MPTEQVGLTGGLKQVVTPGASLIKTRLVSYLQIQMIPFIQIPIILKLETTAVRMLILLLQMEEQRFCVLKKVLPVGD